MNSRGSQKQLTGKVHEHVYAPRGGCREVFESRAEEVLISGPAGTGKSRACLEKIFTICLLNKNVRALILRKTLTSLGSTALVTWRNFVIKEALETGEVVYYGGSAQEPAQYRFKNGSVVIIGGLDKPTRIMSAEYDIIYIQEATEITLDDLEMVKTRLRNWKISFQQLIMDCNPAGDKHPLKLRCADKKCVLIESRHEDNPRLFEECAPDAEGALVYYDVPSGYVKVTAQGAAYINGILDKLTGVRYKRLRLGLWVSAEGIVYEEFDPAVHVLKWQYDEQGNRLPLPDDWDRYWVIDFGYVHPFVLKCYAIGDDGEIYMYREIYHTQRLVEEHATHILSLVTERKVTQWYDHINGVDREREELVWTEPKPVAIICDWDAEGRKTFEKYTGLGTQRASKEIATGIDEHKRRLKLDERGMAQFYLMEDALVEKDPWLVEHLLPTCTLDEYASYIWKVRPDGRINPEPVDLDNHGMDTDRYMSMYFFKGKARATMIDA